MDNTFDKLDFSRYNIVHISPVCYEKNNICFHNIKISIKDNLKIMEGDTILMDGITITKYMMYNLIDIPFHFAQYTENGHKN